MRIDIKDIKNNFGVTKAKSIKNRGFGIEVDENIRLHPVEVAYLALKGSDVYCNNKILSTLNVLKWSLSQPKNLPYFFVYRDLRERGYRIKISGSLIVGNKNFFPVFERDIIDLNKIYNLSGKLKNFIVAVVDEEGEVTYYDVKIPKMEGSQENKKIKKFKAIFTGSVIMTDYLEIFERHFYGSLRHGTVTLSLVEGIYLAEKGIMSLDVSIEDIKLKASEIDKDFETRYMFYKDLKNRKFVVKTGFKFGSDFRVYERVNSVKDLPHSKYLVKIARKMRASEMASHVRVANSVRKKMVFAFYSRSSPLEDKYARGISIDEIVGANTKETVKLGKNIDSDIKYVCFNRIKV